MKSGVATDALIEVVASDNDWGTSTARMAEVSFACRRPGTGAIQLDREGETCAFYGEIATL